MLLIQESDRCVANGFHFPAGGGQLEMNTRCVQIDLNDMHALISRRRFRARDHGYAGERPSDRLGAVDWSKRPANDKRNGKPYSRAGKH
jgi:hypothetical protein